MTFLDTVRADREPLAYVLRKHQGIRRIVEDLYPDRAHFIYELLQNAEDAGAHEARFILEPGSLIFEHDGRPFTEEDVEGITDIGDGTKSGGDDTIGRFGVGFKAVFAFSETPCIWSPTFSFKLADLVLPFGIPAKQELGTRTRFRFPFNNPKKPAEQAYGEVKVGLGSLAATTLLFLTNLRSVEWQIGTEPLCVIQRIRHSSHHLEVSKQAGLQVFDNAHFLCFTQAVEGLPRQNVAVAYELEFSVNVTTFDPEKPLFRQMRIVPADPGQVAVFFPAEKETSGLRFHLHAPFVPELSRASVKETEANGPLFDQLAGLAARSLHDIRDARMLTVNFLGVLPNQQDPLPTRYQVIRTAILKEMNEHPLTPIRAQRIGQAGTGSGDEPDKTVNSLAKFAPAKYLVQAEKPLKNLLSEEDLNFLIGSTDALLHWSVGANKNSNPERLLSSLEIRIWGIDCFVKLLEEKANTQPRRDAARYLVQQQLDPDFSRWLAAKPMEWHQEMYAMLGREGDLAKMAFRLFSLNIVRLSNGRYSTGRKCFFPTAEVEHDEALPRVAIGTYTSGKDKGAEQASAKKFLEMIGVREVGDVERIQVILLQRYKSPNVQPLVTDLNLFMDFLDRNPPQAQMFKEKPIFKRLDGKWGSPEELFLDAPFLDTGLTAYYEAIGNAFISPLAETYADDPDFMVKVVKFALQVGVQSHLAFKEVSCDENPRWSYLRNVSGERYNKSINRDYTIEGIPAILRHPTLELTRLIWNTMSAAPRVPNILRAQYQKNEANGSLFDDSQLIHHLRAAAWVPQDNGRFVRPGMASRSSLPQGFPYDAGQAWLKAVGFGEDLVKQSEEEKKKQALATELGFGDVEVLERAQKFARLPAQAQQHLLAVFEQMKDAELPTHETRNPGLRASRVAQEASQAPECITEIRPRSVAVGAREIKEEAAEYLREQYMTSDGVMYCQACRAELPFKLDDGSYYVEKVQICQGFRKLHYQNYLALCPNHAAMYSHANASSSQMRELLLGAAGTDVEIVLAQQKVRLLFTRTHLADFRVVAQEEEQDRQTTPHRTAVAECAPDVVAAHGGVNAQELCTAQQVSHTSTAFIRG